MYSITSRFPPPLKLVLNSYSAEGLGVSFVIFNQFKLLLNLLSLVRHIVTLFKLSG